MKIFISWSGERSQIFAKALHEWLPMVLQSVVPWLSHADISAGERWADTVAKELEASEFGITCVTRENMSSTWIHFEAGALAKRMQEGRVIPLLLDIEFKEISGPLAQFQAKKADREGVLDVVSAINELSKTKVLEPLLSKQFNALWPTLEKQINETQETQIPARQQRPQRDVLEELVSIIRGLDVKVRETIEERPVLRRRKGRLHPGLIMELNHFTREHMDIRGSHLNILILLSFIRDDFPWLYDMGVDAYQQAARDMPNAKQAQQRLLKTMRLLRHGPWLELSDNKENYLILREVEHLTQGLIEIESEPESSKGHIKARRIKNNPSAVDDVKE